jgi:hypothetical protein
MTYDSAQWEFALEVATSQSFEHSQHAIRIKSPVAKIDVRVDPELELTTPLRGNQVDPGLEQTPAVGGVLTGVYHVNGLVVTREPLRNER